jgi:hypothetical protein
MKAIRPNNALAPIAKGEEDDVKNKPPLPPTVHISGTDEDSVGVRARNAFWFCVPATEPATTAVCPDEETINEG